MRSLVWVSDRKFVVLAALVDIDKQEVVHKEVILGTDNREEAERFISLAAGRKEGEEEK